MRLLNCLLVSFATFGCIAAQDQNPAPQKNQPEKPKLDFTFPPLRLLRRPPPPNPLLRPTVNLIPGGQNLLPSETPSPCSIPLLEAQIPKDIDFTMKRLRPRLDELAPMPKVNVPAPSCADKPEAASRR
jgi:hypothetical protein